MIGPLLDRFTFWNIPAFLRSYELQVEHHIYFHSGLEVWNIPGSESGPTVLFCHGNAGHLRFPNARGNRFLALHEAGANLWVFDYRGYGKSLGHPTENGVYEDAFEVHRLVREEHPEGNPFVLYGRSLGGAVATFLATQIKEPDYMILESTFTSVQDVCASWSHPKLAEMMSYEFNSLERIKSLTCPLYMIHGDSDQIVKYRFGRKLYQACPTGREFVTVMGAGHNDLQETAAGLYEETLKRWLRPD